MSHSAVNFVIGIGFGLVVVFILAGLAWDHAAARAIENGCASYNTTTGVFEWNDEKDKP